MTAYQFKKLPPASEGETGSGSSKRRNHVWVYVVFIVTLAIVICFGFADIISGLALGRCQNNTDRHVMKGDVPVVQENSVNLDKGLNRLTVDMAIEDEPREGECYCTTVGGIALLREADIFPGTTASVQEGQCFRLVESSIRQRDGQILYRLINTETNQIGWIRRDFLKRNRMCGLPEFRRDDYDIGLGFARGLVSQLCLQCICELESKCKPIGCHMDVGSLSCGYFQIKQMYWEDCGRPGNDLKTCGDDIQCSSQCVQNYMKRYQPNSGCPKTCQTYAREHNGGPHGCTSTSTLDYWKRLTGLPGCKNPSTR